jgi:hypothetical protein
MRMKCSIAWFAGVFLFLILAVIVSAQDQKKTSIKEDRLSGTVHTIDKDTSSIIIQSISLKVFEADLGPSHSPGHPKCDRRHC